MSEFTLESKGNIYEGQRFSLIHFTPFIIPYSISLQPTHSNYKQTNAFSKNPLETTFTFLKENYHSSWTTIRFWPLKVAQDSISSHRLLFFKGQQEKCKILLLAFSESRVIWCCKNQYILETAFHGKCKPSCYLILGLYKLKQIAATIIPGCESLLQI